MINTEANHQWFVLYQDQLLLGKNDSAPSIPTDENAPVTIPRRTAVHTTSTAAGMVYKVFYTDSPIAETPEYVQMGLRISCNYLSQEHYQATGKVHGILYWDRSNRCCPICETSLVQRESIMRECPNCGREIHPVILAAILVLMRREDSLSLVHARDFKGILNSLVAGLLETDEILKECVAREVEEETGPDAKNIRYFGGQPWPYPNELMVGFIADYAGGDIHLQDDKLSSENFYTRDHLSKLPRKLSLARKIVDWWTAQQ